MANMKINSSITDEVILAELGERLAQRRIVLHLTQAALAEKAGVSKRTVERVEAGLSAQMESVIRIFRVLDLLEGLNLLIPETAGATPMDLLKRQGKKRQRASSVRREKISSQPWTWGEDAKRC